MINKQLKIRVGGVNRSTPIDLKTIDSEVALLSGRATQTPISMEALWNEVQNLKATAKSWEIVTINPASNKYLIPEKFRSGWNWCILSSSQSIRGIATPFYKAIVKLKDNGMSHWCEMRSDGLSGYRGFTFDYRIDGEYLVPSYVSYEGTSSITVLFYK